MRCEIVGELAAPAAISRSMRASPAARGATPPPRPRRRETQHIAAAELAARMDQSRRGQSRTTTSRSVPDSRAPDFARPAEHLAHRGAALVAREALEFFGRRIEAHDGVGEPVGDPDLVLVVDIDRVAAGCRCSAAPRPSRPSPPDRSGRPRRCARSSPTAGPWSPTRCGAGRRRAWAARPSARRRSRCRSWRCDRRRARRTRPRRSASW